MPFHVKTVVTRPNIDAPWYVFSEEFRTHFLNTYKDVAWLGKTVEFSDDNLQRTITNIWIDSDMFRNSLLDPIVESEINNRNNHHSIFNMTSSDEYINVP